MGLIDIDLGLGDLIEIGEKTKSAIHKAVSNNANTESAKEENNEDANNVSGGHIVIKCPGCGHNSAINDGDGITDRCEYCGTVIGN